METTEKPGKQTPFKWTRAVVEYGPIFIFFVVYWVWGLFAATASIMAATCVAIVLSYFVDQKIPGIALVTAVIVGVFGGLTLWLQDETFIKMKPTIIQMVFGTTLLVGLLAKKIFLKTLLGSAWHMDIVGWKILTWRLALFFFAMAFLNEIVWRTQTTDFWVNFKVFGIMALTLVFLVCQTPLLKIYGTRVDD